MWPVKILLYKFGKVERKKFINGEDIIENPRQKNHFKVLVFIFARGSLKYWSFGLLITNGSFNGKVSSRCCFMKLYKTKNLKISPQSLNN